MYVALLLRYIDLQQVGVFSPSSFCLLVSDKFSKKYDLFKLLGTGQNLLGAWGRCKRPWGGHFLLL